MTLNSPPSYEGGVLFWIAIEAKPHRVVHFSEVAAVIIPDTLSIKEEIKEVAKENNFKV